MTTMALTRAVSGSLAQCELTHLERQPIDLEEARRQHAAYEAALEALGAQVRQLAEAPDLPDAVFIEDTAVVFDELAVMTRPGAATRRAEVEATAQALAPYRKLAFIQAPATLDGGDVLRIGRRVYVGLSSRSSGAGIEQLQAMLAPYGYTVEGVRLQECLHLKSAVTQAGAETILLNPGWLAAGEAERAFGGLRRIEVDPGEPFAANALLLGEGLIQAAEQARTAERLRQAGLNVHPVPASELAKAEGGVTCCSLIFTI